MKPDGALALIDFEVHQYQPLAEGLVRFCQRQDKETGDKILSFFRGYNTVRPLTKPEMEYLEKELSIKLEL